MGVVIRNALRAHDAGLANKSPVAGVVGTALTAQKLERGGGEDTFEGIW